MPRYCAKRNYCIKNITQTNEIAPLGPMDSEVRPFSDVGNNRAQPLIGAADTPLLRTSPVAYADGTSALADRTPSPRVVSNAVHSQTASILNSDGLSDMFWLWGQFVDHDVDLTHTQSGSGAEMASMTTPLDDAYPGRTIPFTRSQFIVDDFGVRQQINDISSFLDGTNVYGGQESRATYLRALDGSGKLRLVAGTASELVLPKNLAGLPNAQEPPFANPATFFIAGDERANENALLTAMHTLFAREHNYWCERIVKWRPEYTGLDEPVFQQARRIVSGIIQSITFNEFLPLLLGGIPSYGGYNPEVNGAIANEFAHCAYRVGHTMVSDELRVNSAGDTLPLRDLFFAPQYIDANGVNALLVGASKHQMQELDVFIVDALRNFLFNVVDEAGMLLDLASLNIQRGRDHGLPDYNTLRVAYGLTARASFAEISSDSAVVARLQSAYASVDDIDPWTGGLAEDHVQGAQVGELFHAIIRDQFLRLRAGDRFWFEHDPAISPSLRAEIRAVRLADVLRRNLDEASAAMIADDVFHV